MVWPITSPIDSAYPDEENTAPSRSTASTPSYDSTFTISRSPAISSLTLIVPSASAMLPW